MKANRKVEANRANAWKSTGPRTGAGKLRSRRNAIRHGLTSKQDRPSEAIARIADELCKDDPFPYREHYALAIAEAQVTIERVRKARVAAIERLRELEVRAPPVGLLNRALRLIEDGDVKGIIALLRRLTAVNKELLKRMKAGETTLPMQGRVAEHFAEFFASRGETPPKSIISRSELECVLHALPQLIRLERYERRALGRKRRGIRAFAARLDA